MHRRRFIGVGILVVAVFLVAPSVAHAELTATFNSGLLSVESDAGDSITITCDVSGDVKVNGSDPPIDPPGQVECNAVTDIGVYGGAEANVISLTGVSPTEFPALSDIWVYGGDGNDPITGGPFSEELGGGGGADTISGGDGNDWLYGDDDNDVLRGGGGTDSLYGELGADEQYGDAGKDFVDGGIEDTVLNGGDGHDTLTLYGSVDGETLDADALSAGFETASIYGLGGNDMLLGLSGDDLLNGGEGPDHLDGRAGNDFLYGGSGPFDDTLHGGEGDDVLNGGEANDTLRGGGGSDYLYVYDGSPGAYGEEGPDVYEVEFGTLGTVTISDSGSTGTDELYVWPCDGTQVTANQAIRGAEVVNYLGIEQAPCGYSVAPPPPPPPLPPPPPPPPTPQPVAPKPKPKVVKKFTICHNGRTKKVTKKQLQALRKKAAKAKKGAKPKIKMGACKKKPKKKR